MRAFSRKKAVVEPGEENSGRIKRANKADRTYDGIVFASGNEMEQYALLVDLLGKDRIKLKPKFLLQAALKDADGTKFHPVTFNPDFLIEPEEVLIDAKGMIMPDFKIRWKWFVGKYGRSVYMTKTRKELVAVLLAKGLIDQQTADMALVKLKTKKRKCSPTNA